MAESPRQIPLRVVDKKAYVWDVDDIAALRSKHHICGTLVGTLPHLSQQNVFLGVPLLLMPEEVVLLVENEIAILIDDVHAYPQPTAGQLRKWHYELEEDIKQQVVLMEARETKEGAREGRAMSTEALKKRIARQEKKATEAAQLTEVAANSQPLSGTQTVGASSQQTMDTPISKGASAAHTVIIPTTSSSLEWYNPSACSYSTIAAAKTAGIWEYPSTQQERARCGVFRSLWEQGYFMGGGIKFGGDYLVYPGDPLRYHSHFAATVIDSPLFTLRPMEIVAHGRLGTATKKAHLLCGWDDGKKEVSYLTIEWAGFG